MTTKMDVNELSEILFQAIRDVRDLRISPETAETIRGLAAQVTETAKVEVAYLKATGGDRGTGFIPAPDLPVGTRVIGQTAGVTVTQHKLMG